MEKFHYTKSMANVYKPTEYMRIHDYGMTLEGKLNCAVVEIDGTHGPVKLNDIEEILFILEGELLISQQGKDYRVTKGDFFHLKSGEWRVEKGKAEVLAICSPPYDPDKEEWKQN